MTKRRYGWVVAGAFFFSLLVGCASTYEGTMPDFQLTDSASREAELKKFTLSEPFFIGGANFHFKNDPDDKGYSPDSMAVIIEQVVPGAADRIRNAQNFFVAGVLFDVLGLSSLVAYFASGQVHPGWIYATIGAAGLSIGSEIIGVAKIQGIAHDYNEALHRRFLGPTVSMRVDF